MANQEQLKILKKGVRTWNIWKRINFRKKIDLNDASILIRELKGIDLRGADLRGAFFLFATDLRNAGVQLRFPAV